MGVLCLGCRQIGSTKKSLEEIQRGSTCVQQQRAQWAFKRGKSGSSNLTMAERLASKQE